MPARYESYNLLDRLGPATVFTPEFLRQVDQADPHLLLARTFEPYRDCSLINQLLGIDLKLTLADNDLPKVARTCELAGIDAAFPMLHESVVKFSSTLPADLKLRRTKLRYFFKEALRDFLPEEILSKEKHGFGLPFGVWLVEHPPLKELASDALASLGRRGMVQPIFLKQLLEEHLRTHAGYYGTMVWVLMMLELWFQRHLDRTH